MTDTKIIIIRSEPCLSVNEGYKQGQENNMFLRHFFSENDVGGQLFIFYFFEQNAVKQMYPEVNPENF